MDDVGPSLVVQSPAPQHSSSPQLHPAELEHEDDPRPNLVPPSPAGFSSLHHPLPQLVYKVVPVPNLGILPDDMQWWINGNGVIEQTSLDGISFDLPPKPIATAQITTLADHEASFVSTDGPTHENTYPYPVPEIATLVPPIPATAQNKRAPD